MDKLLSDKSNSVQSPYSNTGARKSPHDNPPAGGARLDSVKFHEARGDDWEVVKVGDSDQATFVLIPRADSSVPSHAGFIDWISFTFSEHHALFSEKGPVSDDEFIFALGHYLERIFGFGITSERPMGIAGYTRSFSLGTKFGIVGYGAQRDTVYVSVTGQGCLAAKQGWEQRLYDFLSDLYKITSVKITRVDLAYDDFTGEEYSPELAYSDYQNGKYTFGTLPPSIRRDGDWDNQNEIQGLTVYIGSRNSGKMLRVYHKGRQLGAPFQSMYPDWTRIEVEYRANNRLIPFDVLLNPGHYIAGAYPALFFVSSAQANLSRAQRQMEISYERALHVLKHQFGHYLHVFREIEGDDSALLDKLCRDDIPERLILPDYQTCDPAMQPSGHKENFEAATINW